MLTNKYKIIILTVFLVHSLYAQTILQVNKGFALIDTDAIMEHQKTHQVLRLTDAGAVPVGSVRVVKTSNSHAISEIVEEKDGFKIQPGDFLNLQADKALVEYDIKAYTTYYGRKRLTIEKRIAEYVRFKDEDGDLSNNQTISVYRDSETGIVEMGKLKVIEHRQNFAVAEIIRTDVPLEIGPGDFIFTDKPMSEDALSKTESQPLPSPSSPPGYLGTIARVTDDYFLINDLAHGKVIGDQVTVKREAEFGPEQVAIVEIVIRKPEFLAAKTIRLLKNREILPGDYVTPYEKLEEPRNLPLDEFLRY